VSSRSRIQGLLLTHPGIIVIAQTENDAGRFYVAKSIFRNTSRSKSRGVTPSCVKTAGGYQSKKAGMIDWRED